MRIVVMSDSHGRGDRVRRVIEENLPKAEAFIHLGDGLPEFECLRAMHPDVAFVGVRGNNDITSPEPTNKVMVFGGKRFYLTHGHTLGVKRGGERLVDEALATGAEVVLYGHTHDADARYIDGLWLFNPGALGFWGAEYLCIDIEESGIVPVPKKLRIP